MRRRLSRRLRTKVDSGDIVQSVFADVLGGVRDGGWSFAGQAQLLAFLRRIAWRRLADRYQKHRRGPEPGTVARRAPSSEPPPSRLPRPSQVAQGREFWERVLEGRRPLHHEVVPLKSKGLTGRDRRADGPARGERPADPLRPGPPVRRGAVSQPRSEQSRGRDDGQPHEQAAATSPDPTRGAGSSTLSRLPGRGAGGSREQVAAMAAAWDRGERVTAARDHRAAPRPRRRGGHPAHLRGGLPAPRGRPGASTPPRSSAGTRGGRRSCRPSSTATGCSAPRGRSLPIPRSARPSGRSCCWPSWAGARPAAPSWPPTRRSPTGRSS